MTFPYIIAIADELKELRKAYEGAHPKQRRSVALKRINDPSAYPNDLVTRVSAIEAYARSLLANAGAKNNEEVLKRYKRYARNEATSLVEGYLKCHAIKPRDYFGPEIWELFRVAVDARNILVHECTYLDASKYLPLAHACTEVFSHLGRLEDQPTSKNAA